MDKFFTPILNFIGAETRARTVFSTCPSLELALPASCPGRLHPTAGVRVPRVPCPRLSPLLGLGEKLEREVAAVAHPHRDGGARSPAARKRR